MRTLYRGGHVLQGLSVDPDRPTSTALLVDGESLVWVGEDGRAPATFGLDGDTPDDVRVIDLDGAVVTPGFVDAHVHVTETGLLLAGVDLRAARSVVEILDLVESATRRHGGRPVLGHGWDELLLAEGRPPTRRELDRAAAGGVVYLSRIDAHSAVVSGALAAAADLAELPGWSDDGRVEREAHHAARAAARAGLTAGERRAAQRAALHAAAAAGITCVHEMSAPELASESDLVDLLALAADEPESLPEVVAYRGDLCVDGSVGSHTAAFREPYRDAPGQCGRTYLDAEQVRDHVAACTRAGLQAGFHVIGDAGLDVVLEGLRRAAERVGIAAVRRAGHRLEHLESADFEAVTELADLGVTASVQPAFDAAWGGANGMYAARLGERRALAMNPWAAFAAAGVPLALGSDSPVTPFDPWGAVRACTDHHDPGLRLSAASALRAHTLGGLRAARGGPADPATALLTAGAPATFAAWHAPGVDPADPDLARADLVGELARARPACVLAVRAGRALHDVAGQATGSSSSAGRSL